MTAVGVTVLRDLAELAAQLWQPRPAGLRGRSSALLGGSGRLLVVPIRVAPLGVQ